MKVSGLQRMAYLLLIVAVVFSLFTTASAPTAAVEAASGPLASKVIFFTSDGMRPDYMERYAAAGYMPTYQAMIDQGVIGQNGMVQAFPPNTGAGWYTLATGTFPGEHGSTNNTFFRAGSSDFNSSTAAFSNGVLQADTIAESAERAGKKVVSVEWSGGSRTMTGVKGPVVDYRSFSSNRGLWTNYDVPGQPAGAASFGVQYLRQDLVDAAGWVSVPASTLPAKEGTFSLASYKTNNVPVIANDKYDFYVYAAGSGYDHVLIVPNAMAKDGSKSVADLTVGQWADVKVLLTSGKTGGFYVKSLKFAPDLSQFSLFFTSVARSVASCAVCANAATFEDDLNKWFPSNTAADYAIYESGLVDTATYVEQGLMWKNSIWTYLKYILGTEDVPTVSGGTVKGIGYQPDLLMLGAVETDEFSHMFMSLSVPSVNGITNPYYNNYTEYGELITPEIADGVIRQAYEESDQTLALAKSLMGGNPTMVADSDHGFGSQWLAVNAGNVLWGAGLLKNADGTEVSSNCKAGSGDAKVAVNLAKVCVAGGTAQIYVNSTLPAGVTYEQVRTQAINAFQNLTDPDNPGAQVVLKILKKEELRNVDGSDSLHPSRSGDVVVVLKPPYQFDASTRGKTIAFSQFFGQHGYLPETVDLTSGVNMHATFVAAGPGIRHQDPVAGVRAVDLAPTISFLLGVPGPANARGKILYNLLPNPGLFKEATLLYISDFHGQLTPLSQTADTFSAPSFAIGGAAYLKPWFDLYRSEAQGYGVATNLTSLTLSGGDAVGATPPISNFFGDKPTMTTLNMLGFNADTLGNHNFDRGSQYLRTELIPMAQFPYLSANTVFADSGKYPPEWKPSQVFEFNGFKLGVVGYTLPQLKDLIFPGYLDPFKVTDPAAAVNKEAANLRSKAKVNAVVAVGHLGGDGSDTYNPTGQLVDFATALKGVDAVMGGHTHTEYITYKNGVLVTEAPNSGQRFNRIRLVVNTDTKQVVYKTADFHKPWDIGVTPDPQIQALIDQLNTELAPLMNVQVGSSTVKVPRADSCGNSNGRTCESLVGDIAADALRTTYNTDFAITNSGGLRADLTCPDPDIAGDFCPSYTPPPYLITRGSVLGVLPFGNVVFTVSINGAELKQMLENGVSLMPSAQGKFPQVSGLCFTYDVSAAAGSRVTSVVRQAADGSCTGAPVDLTTASTYKIAENDYMATGGDGYPNLYARGATQDIMDQVLANYITARTPLDPKLQGRIKCTTSGAVACPVTIP